MGYILKSHWHGRWVFCFKIIVTRQLTSEMHNSEIMKLCGITEKYSKRYSNKITNKERINE